MIRRPPRSPLFPYPTLSRPRRSHERDASRVVHELGVDVFRGAKHDEPRPPRRARHLVPHPQMPLVTAVVARPDLVDRSHGLFGRLGGLSGLAPDLLARSEEHTSELQSPCNLVCRLLLEKKKISMVSHSAQ